MQTAQYILSLAVLAWLGAVGYATPPSVTSAPALDAAAPAEPPPAPDRVVKVEGASPAEFTEQSETWPLTWGLLGFRGFVTGSQAAPNGVDFEPLFSLDFNFNLWLWKDGGVYGFTETRFWGQRAAPGITNGSQGALDFSKREFDLILGAAWNYFDNLEARVFAYSQNNLNRGTSLARPIGFIDGIGLENRWYVAGSYANLGHPGFDVSRASFLSAGYYPTKDMVDVDGFQFKPGPFVRAYLTHDLFDPTNYVFADVQGIATQSFTPKVILFDAGAAWRPFECVPHLEFRAGSSGTIDLRVKEQNVLFYGSVRVIF